MRIEIAASPGRKASEHTPVASSAGSFAPMNRDWSILFCIHPENHANSSMLLIGLAMEDICFGRNLLAMGRPRLQLRIGFCVAAPLPF